MTQPKSMSPQQIIDIATAALKAFGCRIGHSVAGDQSGNEYTIKIEG